MHLLYIVSTVHKQHTTSHPLLKATEEEKEEEIISRKVHSSAPCPFVCYNHFFGLLWDIHRERRLSLSEASDIVKRCITSVKRAWNNEM